MDPRSLVPTSANRTEIQPFRSKYRSLLNALAGTVLHRAGNIVGLRVVVGKVKNLDQLKSILASIPLRLEISEWNCVEWVKEALQTVEQDGKALG